METKEPQESTAVRALRVIGYIPVAVVASVLTMWLSEKVGSFLIRSDRALDEAFDPFFSDRGYGWEYLMNTAWASAMGGAVLIYLGRSISPWKSYLACLPLLAGALLACWYLFPEEPSGISLLSFAVYLGVSGWLTWSAYYDDDYTDESSD